MAIFEGLAIKSALSAAGGFLAKVPREVWYALAALAAWWIFSSHYIEQGREKERAVWEAEVERIRAERDAAIAVAVENDAIIANAGESAIEQARKELDNATANIPDQGLSARQRARACYELQRQGRRCEADGLSASPD